MLIFAFAIVGPLFSNSALAVAAMLIPTNDNFYAVDRAELPLFGPRTYAVPAYDAETEANDQAYAQIPGPRCDGEGHSPGRN